jgi:hypothetical protein
VHTLTPVLSRRRFIQRGFEALALTMAAGRAHAQPRPAPNTGAVPLDASNPIRPIAAAATVGVAGFPFHPHWLGDYFDADDMPFHYPENTFPGGEPPQPTERADVVVIGGGLSGLASAYLLRRHRPILLELHGRFGGYSQGESWDGLSCSLGGAYFITPDPGSFLNRFYRELGLTPLRRETFGNTDDPYEVDGRYVEARDFWAAADLPPEDREGFRQYGALVSRYVDQYPDIPLDPAADNQWIRDLDLISLEAHIRKTLTVPVPRRLAAALQGYCYSSFGCGWGEVSAASGWNFIAAEEFGRWVLPGGNAGLARAIWERLAQQEHPRGFSPPLLRAGCRVVDVRLAGPDEVRVTYRGADGVFRCIAARRVVAACPKHVCRHIIRGWADLAPEQFTATYRVETYPYVVANVLIDAPMARAFYDLFLLGDGSIADMTPEHLPLTDALDGLFAERGAPQRTILTLYWPRPFPSARFGILAEQGWANYAAAIAARLPDLLSLVGTDARRVRQVRLARWGHAMPLARPTLIADGTCELLRRPLLDRVFFVNQDNWALPAVETALLEAQAMRPLVENGL